MLQLRSRGTPAWQPAPLTRQSARQLLRFHRRPAGEHELGDAVDETGGVEIGDGVLGTGARGLVAGAGLG
jgi:hypothetical protein